MRRTLRAAALVALLGLICLGLGVAFVDGIRWRAAIVAGKVTGRMPDLIWDDVWPLMDPRTRVWPGEIGTLRNPYWAVSAPDASAADIVAGAESYQAKCASCHGVKGAGGSARPLLSGDLRHGASDWALYRNIQRGIPGTAMGPSDLAPASIWQIVSYLRTEALAANPFRRPAQNATSPLGLREVGANDLARAAAGSPDWLTYSGSYDGQRHSPLDQIQRENVASMKIAWMLQLAAAEAPVQNTPLVAGGVMFVNLPDGQVSAIDAATGDIIWSRPPRHPLPADFVRPVEGVQGRGMALLGTTLYVPTADAHLMAIDARRGEILWDIEVADYKAGYSIVGAPLAVNDRIVVGVAGSDRGVRGFLDAYSPADGKRAWRFWTVPEPNEAGHDTWGTSDAWRRGGGLTPTTGSYDAALDLIYWGVGNPAPAFQGDIRAGDNLYTSSVIALEARTGRLRWHFQINPHDEHDWGAAHTPILVDESLVSGVQKLLLLASRNGFFYTLDRVTGKFLSAAPFATQTWNRGFGTSGRPDELPDSRPTSKGRLIYPGHAGATGWSPPSYDPASGLTFVATRNGYANVYYKSQLLTWPDGAYWGGRGGAIEGVAIATEIRALSRTSGAVQWTYRFPGTVNYAGGGVLSTNGGLVFAGEKTRFAGLDSSTGRELWHFNTGGTIDAAPITYRAGERQFVAVVAGRTVLAFTLIDR